MRRGRKVAAFVVGLLVLAVLCNLSRIRRFCQKVQSRAYGTGLTSVCAMSDIARGDLHSSEGMPKVVVFEKQSGILLSTLQEELPDEWRAQTAEEVELVVCLERRMHEWQECEYIGGPSIKRYRIDYYATVVDPATTRLVAEGTVAGGIPSYCPESY